MHYILRRKGSGRESCEAIIAEMEQDIRIARNDRPLRGKVDTVIRWGCTTPIQAKTIINEARAVSLASNKTAFRRILNKAKLCPPTWFMEEDHAAYMNKRVIVRPQKHELGYNLYACKTALEIAEAISKCGEDAYVSEFIDKVREIRVFVVSGRVAWVADKIPDDKSRVAWNAAIGALFYNIKFGEWPLRAVKAALAAMTLSGLDFGAVDVIIDKADKPYILEINTCAGLESPYRSKCIAKCFDYILEYRLKGPIPIVDKKGGYLKFIHPAIDPKALV